MIYLDTSVLLAQVLSEDRRAPALIWEDTLVSSRLLEYEVWNRLHAKNLGGSHGEAVQALIGRISLLELSPAVMARALDPFPVVVRTLDALHLAAVFFLIDQKQSVQLASFDSRMLLAAEAMGFEVVDLAG